MKRQILKQIGNKYFESFAANGFEVYKTVPGAFSVRKPNKDGFYPIVNLLESAKSKLFSFDLYGGVQHREFLDIVEKTMIAESFVSIPICLFFPEVSISRLDGFNDDPNLDEKLERHFGGYIAALELWAKENSSWEKLLSIGLKTKSGSWHFYAVAILFKKLGEVVEMEKWLENSENNVIRPDEYRDFASKLRALEI